MPHEQTRRNFLIQTGGILLSAANAPLSYGRQEGLQVEKDPNYGLPIIISHTVPNSAKEPNIENIVKALSSGKTIGEQDYLPDFIDLVQYFHSKSAGMTYPEHMKRTHGTVSPIEVMVLDDPNHRSPKLSFVHENADSSANILTIRSTAKYPELLDLLTHGMSYSFNGPGELKAHASAYRDVLSMISIFPQLLRERDSECPLSSITERYIGLPVSPRENLFQGLNLTTLPYLILIGYQLTFDTFHEKSFGIDEAVDIAVKYSPSLDAGLGIAAVNLLRRRDDVMLRDVLSEAINKTEHYILGKNPGMPEAKKVILRGKMENLKRTRLLEKKTESIRDL